MIALLAYLFVLLLVGALKFLVILLYFPFMLIKWLIVCIVGLLSGNNDNEWDT